MARYFGFMALPFLLFTPAVAAEPVWRLLSREDGCLGLELLTKREKLPRTPSSPEEFAAMMRERGYSVTVAPPQGFPPELSGKALQVTVRDNLAPVFVTDDLCHQLDN